MDINTHFSKDNVKASNKSEKMLNLIVRETEIKCTIRYHLTLVRMVITQLKKKKDTGEAAEKEDTGPLLVKMQSSSDTMESTSEIAQRT